MPVSFNNIPSSLRLPLFFAEVDGSRAGVARPHGRALVLGYKSSAGVAPVHVPRRVASKTQAIEAAGPGSQAADMLDAWFDSNAFDEVWYLPLAEPGAGVAATGTVTLTGPASAPGAIALYIAGRLVETAIVAGDSAAQMATKLAAAIQADPRLVVSATAAAAVVTLAAKWKGLETNGIDIRLNYLGSAGGEALPSGVGVAIVAMASGSGVPDITTALTALGDWPCDTIVVPWIDTATLNAVDGLLDHDGDVGRWSWAKQMFGHAYTAAAGTAGTLQTFGNGRNGAHITCVGYRGSPTPTWQMAAMYAGRAHRALQADPARPLHTLALKGFKQATPAEQFNTNERNALAYDGISTLRDNDDGTVSIETSLTMYQRNPFGTDDDAYLKVQTCATLAYLLRSLRHRVESKFPRHKLGNDGTRYGPGQAITTPKTIKAELTAQYREFEFIGLVENADAFAEHLIVERDPTNPNRVNVLWPPDLINQLDVFAVLAQFRLQYPDQLPDRAAA